MKRRPIPFPLMEGTGPRQAHADLPPGTYERELGREGFEGPSSHMVHRHPPTAWSDFSGPLRPRAYDLNRLEGAPLSPWSATTLLANPALKLRFWRLAAAMPALARNADGDELIFVHQGAGELYCDYGHLPYQAGDYLLLPRGTMWRLAPAGPCAFLLVEASGGAYGLPERGLLGQHALFDPAVLARPALDQAFRRQQGEDPWRVEIKRGGELSVASFPFNPLDALGWHGDLAPVRLALADIRPVMSHRYHLPPSAHATFAAERFVVCSFVPRPFEDDPGALKVPFFHNNDDVDEVIFYHAGNFFSRDNIAPGMLTFHPAGFTHGPHPRALAHALAPPTAGTEEYAVMIDARDPLTVQPAAALVELADYVDSWKGATP
ncbi:MAG: homogentisate 1,2-dioxygenase [Rhodocyclaceae bacterium]|jgi:homogentisate 1,2-dioxygenase|nr:homogentisate 1,2-dioxygenase [Rhodocyclaceae bacterium]